MPFCIVGLSAIAGPAPLSARVVVVQCDNVNIRQGPSTADEAIGKADKGAIFGWEGGADGWTQMQANGGKGFIRNDLLLAYDEIQVTGSSVRVRATPSLQGSVIGGASRGDRLSVVDIHDIHCPVADVG